MSKKVNLTGKLQTTLVIVVNFEMSDCDCVSCKFLSLRKSCNRLSLLPQSIQKSLSRSLLIVSKKCEVFHILHSLRNFSSYRKGYYYLKTNFPRRMS